MGDQAERVILEGEDLVTPIVGAANASLGNFESKAETVHSKVVRITDQTRTSVQRLISSLEKQAETYGKSGVDRLIVQRDQLLQRYAKEPQAIDAITRSYERMIAIEQKAATEAAAAKAAKEAEEALQKQNAAIQAFGDRVGQFMENPLQGARGALGSVLTTLGPFGVGIVAGATALIAFGAAAFSAAKSLGEYGVATRDAELRTGLTAKEVGQFSFAAKAVGQDISIVERLMRGLSQAADDTSHEGEKARATLQRIGVDLHDASGALKPTSEILFEISEGLNKLPEGLERDAAAMDLFKRVGVEAIPFMTELNENLRIAHEEGFGPTEDDIRRFEEYQREVTVIETKWDSLVRKFKEGIVITVSWAGKGVDWFLNNVTPYGDEQKQRAEEQEQQNYDLDLAKLRTQPGVLQPTGDQGVRMSRAEYRQQMAELQGQAADIVANRESTLKQIQDLRDKQKALLGSPEDQFWNPPSEDAGAKATEIEKQIEALQRRLSIAGEIMRSRDLAAGKEETDRIRAQFFGTHEGIEKAYEEAKHDVDKYRKELFEPDKPLTKEEALDISGKLHAAQADEAKYESTLDAQKQHQEALHSFRTEAQAFEKKGEEAELDAVGKIYAARDHLLQQASLVKASEQEIAAIRKAADEQASAVLKKEANAAEKKWEELLAKSAKISGEVFLQDIAEGNKKLEERSKAVEKLAAEYNKLAAAGESQAVSFRKKMVSITGDSSDPMAILREQQAIDLVEIQRKRQAALADLSKDPAVAFEQRAVAEKEAANAVGELRYQWEEKIAEVQKKAAEDQQKMLDDQEKSISKIADKLIDTLFTKPKDFGKDMLKTIHGAVLKPISEGFGNMTASVLRPVIYGEDGTGGIAGIFKGMFGGGKGGDPIKVSTDENTVATKLNTVHVAAMTAVLAGAMGIAAPTVGGVSMPTISVPAVTRAVTAGGGAVAPSGGFVAGGGFAPGAVGGPSFAELASLPTIDRTAQILGMGPRGMVGTGPNGSFSTAQLASLPMPHDPVMQMLSMEMGGKPQAGGGLFGGGGVSSVLTNLKGAVFNEKAFHSLPIDQTTGMGQFESGAYGVATSPAASTAGLMMATSGLLGSHMGTWGGVGMGTVGGGLLGAGIGQQVGGPEGALIGAGIGAFAGFGIGLAEKLLGIESPQQKAHDDIKSIYGVDIPLNSGTIKQVVNIANSQFGSDIAVAVRSPSVRQLVQLYSEATGQKMPMSATTPYAGSLVEQGGNLYQQATFQNNAWHTYASNLPTLGGITGAQYPTSPGPNTGAGTGTYVSLNINGTPITADYVADQSLAAQNASYGRTQQSANLQVPGLMVA